MEGFGDYEARRVCVGGHARRDRLWRRTNSSECCITHRPSFVNTILPAGEFAHSTAAGSSMSLWCYTLGPELLVQTRYPETETRRTPLASAAAGMRQRDAAGTLRHMVTASVLTFEKLTA